MQFYKHHLGDYMKDTAHLTLVEEGIYRRLLDWYYSNERPLPSDFERICRLVRCEENEKQFVRSILNEFFQSCDEGYRHNRCERELAAWYERSDKAKESAEARWKARDANALRTHCEGNATHYPLPTTHYPEGKDLAAKRRTQISVDFQPDETGISKATESGVVLSTELERFKDYHRGKGSVMLDWQAAWRTWIGYSVKFSQGKKNGSDAKFEARKRVMRELTGYDPDAIKGVSSRVD